MRAASAVSTSRISEANSTGTEVAVDAVVVVVVVDAAAVHAVVVDAAAVDAIVVDRAGVAAPVGCVGAAA
jgi:hypothetical protein